MWVRQGLNTTLTAYRYCHRYRRHNCSVCPALKPVERRPNSQYNTFAVLDHAKLLLEGKLETAPNAPVASGVPRSHAPFEMIES